MQPVLHCLIVVRDAVVQFSIDVMTLADLTSTSYWITIFAYSAGWVEYHFQANIDIGCFWSK